MPEIGVTIERRSSASSASRSASRALLSARSASVTWTAVAVLDDLSAVTRSIRACASSSAILARSTAISSASESSRAMTSPLAICCAGFDQDLGQPAGRVGIDGHRIVGAAGADGRELVVDRGNGDGSDDNRRLRASLPRANRRLRRAFPSWRPQHRPSRFPRRARMSGAPGKNFTQAKAAATRSTSTTRNCFQAAIHTPDVEGAICAGKAEHVSLRRRNPDHVVMTIPARRRTQFIIKSEVRLIGRVRRLSRCLAEAFHFADASCAVRARAGGSVRRPASRRRRTGRPRNPRARAPRCDRQWCDGQSGRSATATGR